MATKNSILFFLLYVSLREVFPIEIQMKYRIFFPFLFKFINSQSFEQFLSSLKVAIKSRNEQDFPKPSWAAEEINVPVFNKVIYQRGLIHINITVFSDFIKTLYSYRVFHLCIIIFACKLTENLSNEQRIKRLLFAFFSLKDKISGTGGGFFNN